MVLSNGTGSFDGWGAAGSAQGRGVRVTIEPDDLTVHPGGQVTTKVTVCNLGTWVEEFELVVQGLGAAFATVIPATVSVYPDVEQRAVVRFAPLLSPGSAAGVSIFEVVVRSVVALWAKIRRTISAFLVNEWRKGALFGLTPDEAFYVRLGHETNPAEKRKINMTHSELDKAVGHSFGLEFDGVQIKQIQEVSGLKMEQDVIELKQNVAPDGKYVIKKLPGRPKAGEVTLIRSVTSDNSFDKLVRDTRSREMHDNARKGGAIVVYDFEGNPLKRYKLTNAWPKSLEIGALKAGDTSILTEKLVITYEELEPE